MQQEAQASRVELLKVQRLRVKENQQLKVMQEALTQAIQNLTELEGRAQVPASPSPFHDVPRSRLEFSVSPSPLDLHEFSLWLLFDEVSRSDLVD